MKRTLDFQRHADCSTHRRLCAWPWVALWLFLSGAAVLHAQKIDANANGMSDVWEWLYGARGLGAAGDADGDGVPNNLESIAGTDPFNSSSVPRISVAGHSPTNFTLSIPCALGKQYQLKSVQG